MFKPGEFVAKYITPHDGGELDDEQIQPNGVDLTIDNILNIEGPAYMSDDEYIKPHRHIAMMNNLDSVPDEIVDDIDTDWVWRLSEGAYIVVYDEEVHIPEGHIGIVFPRSRFLRIGAHLTSALWDSGYEGRGEGTLYVASETYIDPDMAIGQMAMVRADSYKQYSGSHQGERLNE